MNRASDTYRTPSSRPTYTLSVSKFKQRQKTAKRIFEKMVVENCPNFMKNSILNINSNQSRITSMRPTPRHVIDKLPKIKTENHKSNKKKTTHHVQEILSKIGSWFLIRNHKGQKAVWCLI